jgi:hypothetical protein
MPGSARPARTSGYTHAPRLHFRGKRQPCSWSAAHARPRSSVGPCCLVQLDLSSYAPVLRRASHFSFRTHSWSAAHARPRSSVGPCCLVQLDLSSYAPVLRRASHFSFRTHAGHFAGRTLFHFIFRSFMRIARAGLSSLAHAVRARRHCTRCSALCFHPRCSGPTPSTLAVSHPLAHSCTLIGARRPHPWLSIRTRAISPRSSALVDARSPRVDPYLHHQGDNLRVCRQTSKPSGLLGMEVWGMVVSLTRPGARACTCVLPRSPSALGRGRRWCVRPTCRCRACNLRKMSARSRASLRCRRRPSALPESLW